MMSLVSTTLLFACLAQASVPPQGEGAARRLQVIPVDELVLEVKAPIGLPVTSALRQGQHFALLEQNAEKRRLLDSNELVELVKQTSPALFETGGVGIDYHTHSLFVSGPPELVATVRDVVRGLQRQIARPITVEAQLFRCDLKSASAPVVVTEAQLKELTRDLERVASVQAQAMLGLPMQLAHGTRVPFVRDSDVEIAEKAVIANPIMDAALDGIELIVEPHALPGTSDLLVFGQLALGERRGGLSAFAPGTKDLPALDLPRAALTAATFSGRVPSSGALIVTLRSKLGANRLLAISLRTPVEEAKPAGTTLLFPIGALVCDALARDVELGTLGGTVDEVETLKVSDSAESPHEADNLASRVRDALGEGEGAATVVVFGHFLAVRGKEEQHKIASELLASLGNQIARTIDVEIALVADGAAGAPADTIHALRMPALLGRTHVIVHGLEVSMLSDYDCEVASDARILDPKVSSAVSGLGAVFRAFARDTGLGIDLALVAQHVGEPRRRALEGSAGGDLLLADIAASKIGLRGALAAEMPQPFGNGPEVTIDGRTTRTRVTLSVSEASGRR